MQALDDILDIDITGLECFDVYVNELPVVNDHIRGLIQSSLIRRRIALKLKNEVEAAKFEESIATIRTEMRDQNFPEDAVDRVVESVRRYGAPEALFQSEVENVNNWLKVGSIESLAMAASLYELSYVQDSPSIKKWHITSTLQAWESRGEVHRDVIDPEGFIKELLYQRLVAPNRDQMAIKDERSDAWDLDPGKNLSSVGRLAYLYDKTDPGRMHNGIPVGRLSGRFARSGT